MGDGPDSSYKSDRASDGARGGEDESKRNSKGGGSRSGWDYGGDEPSAEAKPARERTKLINKVRVFLKPS